MNVSSVAARVSLVWFAGVWVVACGVDLPVPSGVVVTCAASSQCPAGSGCIIDLGICSSVTRACTEAVGDDLRSAPNGNACTTAGGDAGTCRFGVCTVCGDAIVDAGEDCDDGNASNDDACLVDCSANTCGDGFLNTGVEECDDGNGIDTDPCLTTCVANVCGDRILNVGVETCEDGNDDDNDGCGQCVTTSWSVSETVGYGPWGGNLETVDFGTIGDIAVDPAGNVYVSDISTNVIWRIEAGSRRVRVYAGRAPTADDEGQPAMLARFASPQGLAVDRLGNLFVADTFNRRIVRIDYRTQLVTRVAGGYGCFSGACGDGGPALDAGMGQPQDVSVTEDGGLFVSDNLLSGGGMSGRIRYIDPQSHVIYAWRNVISPAGVTAFGAQSFFYSEENNVSPFKHLLTSWTPTDGFVLVAGDVVCASPTSTCGDGPAAGARFNYPGSLAATADGATVFIADRNDRKMRRLKDGVVSTIAGTGLTCSGDCDTADNAAAVNLDGPTAVAVGPEGAVYFVDGQRRVKRLTPQGATYRLDTIGGSRVREPVYSATAATASTFQEPRSVAAAADGTFFVAESPSARLYRVDTDGLIYRLSGDTGPCGDLATPCGDGQPADQVGVFYRTNTKIGADPAGNLYFIDGVTSFVRRIERGTNRLSTVASATAGLVDPSDVYATADAVYVAERGGARIRRIDSGGALSTVVGTGTVCTDPASCGDGGPRALATLQGPRDIVVTDGGDLLFLDGEADKTTLRRAPAGGGNVERLFAATNLVGSEGLAFDPATQSVLIGFEDEVRRFPLAGVATPIAGGASCSSPAEGISAVNWCLGVLADVARAGNGDLLLANYDGGVLRVDASGLISTAVGETDPLGTGAFMAANLQRPRQIVLAPSQAGQETWWVANGVNVAAIDETRDRIDAIAGYAYGLTTDGTTARYRAPFAEATGVALDARTTPAKLYVSDAGANLIYRIDLVDPADSKTWPVTRYAGNGAASHADTTRLSSAFNQPMGLAFDPASGTLYVADRGNSVIRAVTDAGVRTVAGMPGIALQDFDVPAGTAIEAAHFAFPEGVVLEPRAGGRPNLLVADTGNNQVRRIDQTANVVFVVAGDGSAGIAGSGTARFTSIAAPRSIALDQFGNMFVASGFTVRQVFAGADGLATGDDNLITIYGNSRTDTPMSATSCLSGIAMVPGDAQLTMVDVCAGYYVRLKRTAQ